MLEIRTNKLNSVRKTRHKLEEIIAMEALGQEGIKLIRDSSMVIGTLMNLTSYSAGKARISYTF